MWEPPGAAVGAARRRSGSRPEPVGSRPEPVWEPPESVWEAPDNTGKGKVDMVEEVAEVSRRVPNRSSANEMTWETFRRFWEGTTDLARLGGGGRDVD